MQQESFKQSEILCFQKNIMTFILLAPNGHPGRSCFNTTVSHVCLGQGSVPQNVERAILDQKKMSGATKN